jgi:uncharacterized membrane protein (DUF106 family)
LLIALLKSFLYHELCFVYNAAHHRKQADHGLIKNAALGPFAKKLLRSLPMKKLLTLLFAAALTFSMTAMAQTAGGDTSKDKDTKKEEKKEKKTAKKAAKKEKKAEKKTEKEEKKDDTKK